MEETIRSRTQQVLDDLPVGEQFDWVDRVSIELTTQMLATLFDFPFEDRRKLTRWSDVATGDEEAALSKAKRPDRQSCMSALSISRAYGTNVKKGERNDLVSCLRTARRPKYVGSRVSGQFDFAQVGGNDTTRNSAGGVWALIKIREYAKLRNNPGVILNMVSEIIRWQTPLAHMRRIANKDYELDGQTIKVGDSHGTVRNDCWLYRPPQRIYHRPGQSAQHLSFGFMHRCMGNRLAEMQLKYYGKKCRNAPHD